MCERMRNEKFLLPLRVKIWKGVCLCLALVTSKSGSFASRVKIAVPTSAPF